MEYAENIYRIITNFTEILVSKGFTNAVLCPGSRSAPVALGILRNPKIKSYIINDERSAGYIALGIAQQTRKAVVLVSTSGTATLNFAPALAEAFFQEIPLLVITADRPPEWIAQNENQTIFQNNLYEPNILKSFQLHIFYNDSDAEFEAYRIINEAINTAHYPVEGPVHINIPLREPLYLSGKPVPETGKIKIIDAIQSEHVINNQIQKEIVGKLSEFKKIMIIAGLNPPNIKLQRNLNKFLSFTDVVFVPDITSNLHATERAILHPETIVKNLNTHQKEELKPDFLITFGGQIVSNIFKNYLRQYTPAAHWHLDFSGRTIDSYMSLTRVINITPEYFFKILLKNIGFFKTKSYEGYFKKWEKLDIQAGKNLLPDPGHKNKEEQNLVYHIISKLPKNSIIQVGNSLPVRYFNNLKLNHNINFKNLEIFSNRGTSGIDGVLSTAVGCALSTTKIVTLVIGDLSFLYDNNGLWNIYKPSNLKIIILNNHGGQIFSKIPGSKDQPELKDYFITNQPHNMKEIATRFDVNYLYCKNLSEAELFINKLYSVNDKTVILEFDIV